MPSVLSAPVRDGLVADLRGLVGDRCTTNPTQLEHHSHGESWHDHAPPDVVVFPTSTDEVSAVMKVAARHHAPVIQTDEAVGIPAIFVRKGAVQMAPLFHHA